MTIGGVSTSMGAAANTLTQRTHVRSSIANERCPITSSLSERIAAATVSAAIVRARTTPGGTVAEHDGLVVCLTNLPFAHLNVTAVRRHPEDPEAALGWARDEFRSHGHDFFGIEVERGRHRGLERAIEGAGLPVLQRRPVLAARLDSLSRPVVPDGFEIRPVDSLDALDEAALVDSEVFGTDNAISAWYPGPSTLDGSASRVFVAYVGDEPVGQSIAGLLAATVGIFGVAVVDRVRRRGLGAALTLTAAHAFGDEADIAWLQPTPEAGPMYAALGFSAVSDWVVYGT